MFQQRHLWALANMIKADHETFSYPVTVAIADEMARHNSGFRRGLFMRAAGWEVAPEPVPVLVLVA